MTAVSYAGSRHEVDQPHHHLVVQDTSMCATRCLEEYGNPWESFCPAAVYKTCDIADPYEIITWTTPEGGHGPDYTLM